MTTDRSSNRSHVPDLPDEPLVLHPGVRLQILDRNKTAWVAEDIMALRRFRLPGPAVVLMVLAIRPSRTSDLISKASSITGREVATLTKLLGRLRQENLIISAAAYADRQDIGRFRAVRRAWRDRGWEEAAEYHLATLNYPFLDYARGGRQVDTRQMRSYAAVEPDNGREKVVVGEARYTVPHLRAVAIEASLFVCLEDGLEEDDDRRGGQQRRFDGETLLKALSLAFAEVNSISTSRWTAAPLLHRTSPSGGARHPTEAYVLAWDVAGIDAGCYHLEPRSRTLMRYRECPTEPERSTTFVGSVARAPFAAGGVVILTSLFDRNMWRYREPRTFRTVHMDVGHLAETFLIAAAAQNVSSFAAYNDIDEAVESIIGVDGLTEGYMMSIAI